MSFRILLSKDIWNMREYSTFWYLYIATCSKKTCITVHIHARCTCTLRLSIITRTILRYMISNLYCKGGNV